MNAARRTQLALKFAVGMTALLLGSCANGQQQVAGHLYDVPDANLISKSTYPFSLPKSDEHEFIFILNPQAELHQQRNVVVQDREGVCARANKSGYVSRTICGPKIVEWQRLGWLKKGDDTFWTYSPDSASGADAPFVSCHKMEIEGHTGLCSATFALGDLALTISLNDDELPTLEATYQRAAAMLRSWEV